MSYIRRKKEKYRTVNKFSQPIHPVHQTKHWVLGKTACDLVTEDSKGHKVAQTTSNTAFPNFSLLESKFNIFVTFFSVSLCIQE